MQKLSRIFYIYSDASVAAFMLFGAVIEAACGAVINDSFFSMFAFGSSIVFAVAALLLAVSIYRKETALS